MKLFIIILVVSIYSLTGCVSSPRRSISDLTDASTKQMNTKCSDLVTAEKLAISMEDSILLEWEATETQYDPAYWEQFDRDEYLNSFIDGYWGGFWSNHKYCLICQENDDVPQQYLQENTKCSDLVTAEELAISMEDSILLEWEVMETQYDSAYWEQFDRDEYFNSFVDGYWDGFWSSHKYCLICQENDDVPQKYLHD